MEESVLDRRKIFLMISLGTTLVALPGFAFAAPPQIKFSTARAQAGDPPSQVILARCQDIERRNGRPVASGSTGSPHAVQPCPIRLDESRGACRSTVFALQRDAGTGVSGFCRRRASGEDPRRINRVQRSRVRVRPILSARYGTGGKSAVRRPGDQWMRGRVGQERSSSARVSQEHQRVFWCAAVFDFRRWNGL